MSTIRSHRDLLVWQKAMDFAEQTYVVTRKFPVDERFGLTSQLRRAASSVPANIAEGHARETRRDYANFLAIAQGSLAECETFLLLSGRLGYIDGPMLESSLLSLNEIARMMSTLRARLRAPARDKSS